MERILLLPVAVQEQIWLGGLNSEWVEERKQPRGSLGSLQQRRFAKSSQLPNSNIN